MRTVLLLVSIATIALGQARVAVPMGPPPGSRSLWVLSADNKLSRYDVAQWRPLSSIPVSADVRKRPEDLIISNAGDVLFTKEEPYEEGLRHFSFIDFRVRTTLVGGAFERRPATGGGYL